MHEPRSLRLVSGVCLATVVALIIAATVFQVPVRSLFFVGMLALCPLMHLFMGRGSHTAPSGAAAGADSEDGADVIVGEP